MSLLNKDILALDWDHRQVRAVVARTSKGKVDIRRMFHEPLPEGVAPEDAEAFGRWLGKVLSNHRCGKMRTLMAIPRDQVVLKDLTLPAATPELEVAGLVQFQMQKELPFGADEAVIDYTALDEPGGSRSLGSDGSSGINGSAGLNGANGANGASRSLRPGSPNESGSASPAPNEPPAVRAVLVAATRKEVIAHLNSVADAAGLKLVRIGLRCFCNLQTVRQCAPDEQRRLLLVNVGPELTEIDIIRRDALLFSRSASVPLNEHEDPTEFLNRLTIEVIRSVQAARASAADLEPDAVVVAAPEWLSGTIAERLGPRLDVPAWVLDPCRAIRLPEQQACGAGQFSAVLGMALGEVDGRQAFDFLHPHQPVNLSARKSQRRRTAVLTGTLVVVMAVMVNYIALMFKESDNADYLKQVTALEGEAKKVEKFAKAVSWVNRQDRERPTWIDEYARINEIWLDKWHKDGLAYQFSGTGVDRPDSKDDRGAGWEIRLPGAARDPNVVDSIYAGIGKAYPDCTIKMPKTPVDVSQEFGYRFELIISREPADPARKK